jgi:hypothetical protein
MRTSGRRSRRAAAATAIGALLLAGCTPDASCAAAAPAAASCADLLFRGHGYDEWRAADPPRVLQEVGNATYPACNAADGCDGADLDGFGATDAWQVRGVDLTQAVYGRREGSHQWVIFVRVGVDPETLRPLIDPGVLE